MKKIYKDVENDFYAFSTAASSIIRQLSLAGIAVVWIFKTEANGQFQLPPSTLHIVKLFIICLGLDFLHAFVPSIVYGVMHMKLRRKKEDDEVNYSHLWTLPDWLFYLGKSVILVWAYTELLSFLNNQIIAKTG